MKLTISIKMDNAAFEPAGFEAARILRDLAQRIAARGAVPSDRFELADVNGNTVGQAKVSR